MLFLSAALAAPPLTQAVRPANVVQAVTTYTDPVSAIQMQVPAGWRVRAETFNGVRQLRVVPPKADQRERAAIDVVVRLRPWRRGESLSGLAASFRNQRGDREAAQVVRYLPKAGRLVLDYREGRYVSGRLWIVRRNLHLFQRKDRTRVLEARCAANASEYKTYRKSLELICYSAQLTHGKS
ncbi:hypothetical protein THUN1379_09350 [Paludibacterium sp. THUN1379]|nr:hypothetical protein THUN1379_09350 [Paludibacterium sp. THUN1379]